MDASEQAETILGRGRGGMVCAFFGGLWLGVGLALAGKFSPWVIVAFSGCCLGLFAGSLFLILRGRRLRPKNSARPERYAAVRKQFMWVVIAEVVACAAVAWACSALKRGDLIPVGIAAIVGLHFLPLGRVFRTPEYYVGGSAIAIWCAVSCVLFRGDKMDISVGIGTGAVLWLTGAYGLISSRALLSSASSEPLSAALPK